MTTQLDSNNHYLELTEKELQAVAKLYDPSIIKVRKFDYLDLVEFYYDDKMPRLIDISHIPTLMRELKVLYREQRLQFIMDTFQ